MMLFGSTQQELTKALAVYGTAGVFLGGVITEYLSWPWVFYINVPIAIIALAATPLLMPNAPARSGSIDILGALTVTAGLALAVYSIVRAPEVGWDSGQTWGYLAVSAVLLGAFVLIQSRRREPLMRLGIFTAPNLAAANVAQLLLGAAWIPMWFFLNLYLQQVLGYSAFPAGAALLPMTALIMLGMIVIAPRAMQRFGAKPMIVTGLIVLALGLGWMALVRPTGNFWVDVLPASLVAAAGMSLAFIPSLGTAISAARPEEGGLASGIVNVSYQVGSALGLAAMTAVAASFGANQIGDLPELTNGFSAAFIGAAVIALAGAGVTAVSMRTAQPDTAVEPVLEQH